MDNLVDVYSFRLACYPFSFPFIYMNAGWLGHPRSTFVTLVTNALLQ